MTQSGRCRDVRTAPRLGLGFFLQKGRFCFVYTFRDLFAFKDTRVTKGVIVAVVFTMLAWSVLYQFGYYQGFWTADGGSPA